MVSAMSAFTQLALRPPTMSTADSCLLLPANVYADERRAGREAAGSVRSISRVGRCLLAFKLYTAGAGRPPVQSKRLWMIITLAKIKASSIAVPFVPSITSDSATFTKSRRYKIIAALVGYIARPVLVPTGGSRSQEGQNKNCEQPNNAEQFSHSVSFLSVLPSPDIYARGSPNVSGVKRCPAKTLSEERHAEPSKPPLGTPPVRRAVASTPGLNSPAIHKTGQTLSLWGL